ncbi:MAG: glycosyltransferase [Anaerolineaceae bacterium]|nr:glycosyltransferase [Anaerolineaceae bacterium]
MKSYPKISIITPSYNQAQFLEQTILSVITQDYPNLEYIIVDGASSDESVKIIQKFESQLAWWVSESDKGQSEAVNKGWKKATGEIIGWLNSDDVLLPGAVSRMVAAFRETPQMGLIYGDVYAIDTVGEIFNIMTFDDWDIENLMSFDIISQPGVFMRQDVLEKAGYLDAEIHFLMDTHLWLKMVQLAPIRYLPGPVAAARYHPGAKNVGAGARYGRDAYMIVEWMKTQPLLAEKMNEIPKRVMAGAHRISARYLLDGGDPGHALRDYIKCLTTYPKTALPEWHRMVYAALSLIGLEGLKPLFYSSRLKLRRNRSPVVYRNISEYLSLKNLPDQDPANGTV